MPQLIENLSHKRR